MSENSEKGVHYRVIRKVHPVTGKETLRPVIVDRPTYSINQVVDFGIKNHYFKGQREEIIGTIKGLFSVIKELDKQGVAVSLDGWLRFHSELDGPVDKVTRRLGADNDYHMCVAALKKFQNKITDINWENVDKLEGRLYIYTLSSYASASKELLRETDIVITGKNLQYYDAARGDYAEFSWLDKMGKAQSVRVEPESKSPTMMTFAWPAALDAAPDGAEITITLSSRVGTAANAPEQVARRVTPLAAKVG